MRRMASQPSTLGADHAPIACTLAPGAVGGRLADWAAILDLAKGRRAAGDGGLRVDFADDIDVGELARLVAAERRCCAFLSFVITVDARGIGLEVRAPDDAGEIIAALFGSPDDAGRGTPDRVPQR